MLLHGYSGAVDIIRKSLAQKIADHAIDNIGEDSRKILLKRGYLTDLSPEEERNKLAQFVAILIKSERNNYRGYTILPTNSCNFKCTYCIESEAQGNSSWFKQKLNYDKIKMIFDVIDHLDSEVEIRKHKVVTKRNKDNPIEKEDQFKSPDNRSISLFGGEPLMASNYKIVELIIKMGKERGFHFDVITNGYELNAYYDLIKENFIKRFQITIDGCKDAHDVRRVLRNGSPTFDTIINNIDRIIDMNVNINIRVNVDASNILQLGGFFELYKSKGWNSRKNIAIYLSPVDFFDERTIDFFNLDNLTVLEKYANEFPFIDLNSGMLNKILINALDKKQPLKYAPAYCSSNTGGLVFDADGSIYSCWDVVSLKDYKIGTYFPKFEIFPENIQQMHERSILKIEKCLNCKFALFCAGGCHTRAIRYNGSDLDPKCIYTEMSFNYFIKKIYYQWRNSHQ